LEPIDFLSDPFVLRHIHDAKVKMPKTAIFLNENDNKRHPGTFINTLYNYKVINCGVIMIETRYNFADSDEATSSLHMVLATGIDSPYGGTIGEALDNNGEILLEDGLVTVDGTPVLQITKAKDGVVFAYKGGRSQKITVYTKEPETEAKDLIGDLTDMVEEAIDGSELLNPETVSQDPSPSRPSDAYPCHSE
jgi:hypothetical protein